MKINQLISESEVDEAFPFTQQWKQDRAVDKEIKADIADLTSNLRTWMRGSRLKNLTIDQFKNFLDQKGLDSSTVDSIANDRTSGRTGTPPDAPLTAAEVREYLAKAVRAGFQAQGAGTNKSRFARPTPASSNSSSALPSSLTSAISGLSPAQKAALKSML